MNRKRSWEVVSFDCYGTLVDWEEGIAGAFATEAERDGRALSRERIVAAYHEVEPQVQAEIYRPYRDVLAETALRVADRLEWPLAPDRAGFLADSLPDWPVFADTRPALERLQTRFGIAILSNIDDDLLAATIARIGVPFDWTVTAQQVSSYKPAEGHFREALRRVKDERWRLLHAAQSYVHDVRPAVDLDIDIVWVNRKAERADGPRPLHTVANLTELADWLEV